MNQKLKSTSRLELLQTETLIPQEILLKLSDTHKNDFAFGFCEEMTKAIRAILSLDQKLDKEDKELFKQTLGLATLCYNAGGIIKRDFRILHRPVEDSDIHMIQGRMLYFFKEMDPLLLINTFPKDEEILQCTSGGQNNVIEHIAGYLAEPYSNSEVFTVLVPRDLTSSLLQEKKVEVNRQIISTILKEQVGIARGSMDGIHDRL